MQFAPIGWTNPAAAVQQSLANHRPASTSTHPPEGSVSIEDVASTEKTGDRDANERYDGPPAHPHPSTDQDNAKRGSTEVIDATQLPADDGEIHQLDLQG